MYSTFFKVIYICTYLIVLVLANDYQENLKLTRNNFDIAKYELMNCLNQKSMAHNVRGSGWCSREATDLLSEARILHVIGEMTDEAMELEIGHYVCSISKTEIKAMFSGEDVYNDCLTFTKECGAEYRRVLYLEKEETVSILQRFKSFASDIKKKLNKKSSEEN
ncbi:uncharacterized protein LOC126904612 [Daktulosphaira vitifoliae]|uniref:uncharacterized protein LOC126904612 n=1 Tax=Daktulosphaira vitifoliae TaxID=58002 RepID=UPI0021AAB2BF|nr:uncharacterized protein LOC126904612 [Daktulosphaira vitifoliae]